MTKKRFTWEYSPHDSTGEIIDWIRNECLMTDYLQKYELEEWCQELNKIVDENNQLRKENEQLKEENNRLKQDNEKTKESEENKQLKSKERYCVHCKHLYLDRIVGMWCDIHEGEWGNIDAEYCPDYEKE